jgi:hypothetical protein
MDPATLAAGAVSLLLVHLGKGVERAAEKVGEDVWKAVKTRTQSIYEAIRKRFAGDSYASKTLERMEEKPDDDARQAAVHDILQEKLGEDAEFMAALTQLMQEARRAGADAVIQVIGSGAAAADHSVASGQSGYAAGRDIVIGSDPRPKAPNSNG